MLAQTGPAGTQLMISDALHSRHSVHEKNKWEKFKIFLLVLVFSICAIHFGCNSSSPPHRVQVTDRSTAISQDTISQSLTLIVEIDERGKLRLNKIETGTTRDMSVLAEKLEVIFDDREKAGIDEREVLIDPKSELETEVLDELIGKLGDVKASPITIIRNDR